MIIFSRSLNKCAVAYYRHSAEDKQENSIPVQREFTQKFAAENQIQIIHEEVDAGKTGLIANRPGFERLFADWIKNPNAPHFDYVLVYDVSRWGRFQDQDEAAYLVHLCTKHGKEVVYTSRGFYSEDQRLLGNLEISIQRYMAAEYSRQLSDKVFMGAVKVAQQGYSLGGRSYYGMSRILLDINRKPIRVLMPGERKNVVSERVSFAPTGDE
ncbi:MAG: recombinase family protein, partial [Proteobacteria bacterium]